jgi:hypothetical protein
MDKLEALNEQVIAQYERIFALPPSEIPLALSKYYADLKQSCTKDNPCIECLREQLLQAEDGGQ